eukprot:TRINITY_DN2719_c0_g1_i1.p1 TRINITY_DN2719_c0_g1~~TRINITY_DN2719_c0_g1_i1.p1  ORF type:complete len:210 (-),score=9.74 TRINITY_DN2719_c0_g1_i1:23-631(-)
MQVLLFGIVSLCLSSLASASDCLCPGPCALGYDRDMASCYCWAQNTARARSATGKVSFFPGNLGPPSYSGGCSFCPNAASSPSDPPVTVWINYGLCYGGVHHQNGVEVCNIFYGTQEVCTSWCKEAATTKNLKDGKYTCRYTPRTSYYDSSCHVSGMKDPCEVMYNARRSEDSEEGAVYWSGDVNPLLTGHDITYLGQVDFE